MSELPQTLEQCKLSAEELTAYKSWVDRHDPPVAVVTQLKFFELYLNGNSCLAIQKLNNNWHLGAIVSCAVQGQWEIKRQEHIASLLDGARQRIQQVTLESVNFLADVLAAANKQHGLKLKKFLQSGNEQDLGDLSINSLKQYREAVEMLMKMTGQDSKKTAEITHHHTVEQVPAAATPINSIQAAKLLEILDEDE